jgi:hypothetical protein
MDPHATNGTNRHVKVTTGGFESAAICEKMFRIGRLRDGLARDSVMTCLVMASPSMPLDGKRSYMQCVQM